LINQYSGEFKVTFSITGTAIEQMRQWAPEALQSFRDLAATGCVDFLGETFYHSLAALYDTREWESQVKLHASLIEQEFGVCPKVFRNTELLYDDGLGKGVERLGFAGVLAEGIDEVLGWRSPNFVYRVPDSDIKILLRNHKLSDAIGFKFTSHHECGGRTLTARDYASWIHSVTGNADCVGVFLDYETFGEHLDSSTGIFEFVSALPAAVLEHEEWRFITPSEAVRTMHADTELSFPRLSSWADTARDDSAWRGNEMQRSSLERLYRLRGLIEQAALDPASRASAVEIWRRLQTSDHYYYMSTKQSGDGVVHQYFSPFESPYDAFVSFCNIMKDFEARFALTSERPNDIFPSFEGARKVSGL
jgi:alpha-amylase